MGLKEDIVPYTDGFGLINTKIVPPGVKRSSDNGVLFTSQYLLLLEGNQEPSDPKVLIALESCVTGDGFLHRAPDDTSEDAPDDHYGFLSYAARHLVTKVPELPLKCMHPALIYLSMLSRNHWVVPVPLSPIIALIIATSNLREEPGNTSNKLITWTIIKGLGLRSPICWLAGKLWTWRMKRIYGGSTVGMAKIYFGEQHPFVKHWID